MCDSASSRSNSNARRRVKSHVKFVRFLPQRFRLIGRANIILEDRETSNRVREVERFRVFMAAIDRKGFGITGFGLFRSSRVVVGVAQVPHRVRESQRVVSLSELGDGEFAREYVSVVADAGHYNLLLTVVPSSGLPATSETSVVSAVFWLRARRSPRSAP